MSQLTKFQDAIKGAKSVKDALNLPLVVERFTKNYQATTGRMDGTNRVEQERFAYLECLSQNPDYFKVDNFFHVSVLIKAASTGLSFRDKKIYPMPIFKGSEIIGLKLESSPAGKREMMEMMPEISEVPEPVVVRRGDTFVVDLKNRVVVKHETTDKSDNKVHLDNLVAVYCTVRYKDGKEKDVILYNDDVRKAKSKSKQKSDQSNWELFPFEMAKKSAINRAYRLYHKYPDAVILLKNVEGQVQDASYEEVKDEDDDDETTVTETVNTETGEVTETKETPVEAKVVETPKKEKREPEALI